MSSSKNAASVFDQYVDAYEASNMDVSRYVEGLDRFCELLLAKGKGTLDVLELACGPGNITRVILNRCSQVQILATDLSPKMVARAKRNNPRAETQILDGLQIDELEQTFDAIICGFLLPYLSLKESTELLKKMFAILRGEGLVYLSTIEGDHEMSGLQASSDGKHALMMQYYSESQLRELIESTGFEVLEIDKIQYTNSTGKLVTELGCIFRKVGLDNASS